MFSLSATLRRIERSVYAAFDIFNTIRYDRIWLWYDYDL